MRCLIRGFAFAALVVGSLAALAVPAQAATFVVSRFDDPPPNGCAPGDCSLREAIIAANGAPGSTITLGAGTYTLSIPGFDNAASDESIGDPDIRVGMIITGAGSANTFVQGGATAANAASRVFDNHSPSEVRISGMTIRNGNDVEVESGGCIRNLGVLTLDSVVITGCFSSIVGGGISSYRQLTITNSTITLNTVHGNGNVVNGGGIAGGAGPVLGLASSVTISHSVISNNEASSDGDGDLTANGGGISDTATLTISDTVISGNKAHNCGGGIGTGTTTMIRTTVTGNTARYDCGGFDSDGTMTLDDSTFSNNIAGFNCVGNQCNRAYAGGLENGGTMFVNNSTFSGNTCKVSGGGLLNVGGFTVTITNSTFVGNTCDLGAGITGGGGGGKTYVRNSIVANNTATPPNGGDCSGYFDSQGYNMLQNLTGCYYAAGPGDIVNTAPGVGPLQDNGGPTQTRAILPGSPAFNAGNPSGCKNYNDALFTADQRAFARTSQGRCDIGAYELQPSVVLWSTDNAAHAWLLNGNSFVGMRGFSGPATGWTAQSYSRNSNESYELLWTANNAAQLRFFNADQTSAGTVNFGGPGSGWTATSYFRNPDGSYQLLWTADNAAQIWTLNANGTWGGGVGLGGPGTGWTATSYAHAPDGSHRVLWAKNTSTQNQAQLWTIAAGGGWGGMIGLGGPANGWTATSYQLNGNGSWNVIWTNSNQAQVWTLNANNTWGGMVGLGGPASGWLAQSYYFK